MTCVLDSSALLAFLFDEKGADVVKALLKDARHARCSHAMNLCEVFYIVRRDHGEEVAQEKLAEIMAVGLQPCDDLDAPFWQDAGRIKADFRRVSLADCCGVSLTRRLGGTFYSADHHELDALDAAGLCKIHFIR